MTHICIVYHSGYGHTAKVAEHVKKGVVAAGASADLIKADDSNIDWAHLAKADAIIFGAPTYMGGVSAPFKTFMDASSKVWFKQEWKDKIAAGFTNSGGLSGDKLNSMVQLMVFAAQHGMIWVGQSEMPTGTTAQDINRISSFSGLMAQSDNAPADVTPPAGDLKTAEIFGQRVATITKRLKKA